jgi:hypothetical protein
MIIEKYMCIIEAFYNIILNGTIEKKIEFNYHII